MNWEYSSTLHRNDTIQNLAEQTIQYLRKLISIAPISQWSDRRGTFVDENVHVEALTHPEEILCNIWAEVLGLEKIGVHDNYLELSTDSLMHLEVSLRARQAGLYFSSYQIAKHQTIKTLAASLAPKHGGLVISAESPIVPISTQGTRPPFFCVHPFGGGVSGYFELARYLGNDQPFYGIQAQELVDLSDPQSLYQSVEVMASRYVAAIRISGARPPYFLGGYSYGGGVAYEMARQLTMAGYEVKMVALLDAYPRAAHSTSQPDETSILLEFAQELAAESGATLSIESEDILRIEPDRRAEYIAMQLRNIRTLTNDIGIQLIQRATEGRILRARILEKHRPSTFAGLVVLFRPDDVGDAIRQFLSKNAKDTADISRPTYGWEDVTGTPIEVEFVSGLHHQLLHEPHVGTLAARLQHWLERIQLVQTPTIQNLTVTT